MAGCIPFAAIAHLTDLAVVVTAGICLGRPKSKGVAPASSPHISKQACTTMEYLAGTSFKSRSGSFVWLWP
ncbi:hypothetical protein J3F84DRAFT_382953 [Trichoderma pleuroticola]